MFGPVERVPSDGVYGGKWHTKTHTCTHKHSVACQYPDSVGIPDMNAERHTHTHTSTHAYIHAHSDTLHTQVLRTSISSPLATLERRRSGLAILMTLSHSV